MGRGFAANEYGSRKDKDYNAIISAKNLDLHYQSVTFCTFGSTHRSQGLVTSESKTYMGIPVPLCALPATFRGPPHDLVTDRPGIRVIGGRRVLTFQGRKGVGGISIGASKQKRLRLNASAWAMGGIKTTVEDVLSQLKGREAL